MIVKVRAAVLVQGLMQRLLHRANVDEVVGLWLQLLTLADSIDDVCAAMQCLRWTKALAFERVRDHTATANRNRVGADILARHVYESGSHRSLERAARVARVTLPVHNICRDLDRVADSPTVDVCGV